MNGILLSILHLLFGAVSFFRCLLLKAIGLDSKLAAPEDEHSYRALGGSLMARLLSCRRLGGVNACGRRFEPLLGDLDWSRADSLEVAPHPLIATDECLVSAEIR